MERYLGQYIFHDGKFYKRGFLQINNDKSFVTRLANSGEEWGNTKFVNGILFPISSDKSSQELHSDLLVLLLNKMPPLLESRNVLFQIDKLMIKEFKGIYTYWFAFSGVDLLDLKTLIRPSLALL